MASFVRISALVWADILAAFVMFVMVTYLTDVMNLSTTRAAATINIWSGIASILPIGFAFFVDSLLKGDYYMLLFSSTAYAIGLGFLSLSTPPVTGPCSEYKPECIGHKQKALFYTGLALIAVGMSGHVVSIKPFLDQQIHSNSDDENENEKDGSKGIWQVLGVLLVIVVSIAGGIGLPYIKPWSIRFGIPAICTVVATLMFLTGTHYKHRELEKSPLVAMLRVFVAASFKCRQTHPDPQQLYYDHDDRTHTSSLRCLDKAAMFVTTTSREEEKGKQWTLCTVSEVEDTKIGIRMIPMWATFILIGIVLSVGNTYFIEQANNMNRKLGRIKVPIPIFLLFYEWSKPIATLFYYILSCYSPKKYTPPIGIFVSMVFAVLCCITAAKVENRRLNVIRDHGLVDKPKDTIPMTIFWLLPQYVLLALLDEMSYGSIKDFFANQAPKPMKKYLIYFIKGVRGLGTMASVLSVYVVGRVSENNGKRNWFQQTLNQSRLDRYYWTLAALSAVNLVVYVFVASFYTYKEPIPDSEVNEDEEN